MRWLPVVVAALRNACASPSSPKSGVVRIGVTGPTIARLPIGRQVWLQAAPSLRRRGVTTLGLSDVTRRVAGDLDLDPGCHLPTGTTPIPCSRTLCAADAALSTGGCVACAPCVLGTYLDGGCPSRARKVLDAAASADACGRDLQFHWRCTSSRSLSCATFLHAANANGKPAAGTPLLLEELDSFDIDIGV